MLLILALFMLSPVAATPETVVTFTGSDGKVLSDLRIKVGLPSGMLIQVTSKQGRIRFKTWSPIAVFAVFEVIGKTWTALPTTYKLKPEQDRFEFTIKLQHDSRGGGL